jgi:hypothetical protein
VTCGSAEICSLGECLPDPCLGVECPQYQRCEVTLTTAQCVADWPVLEETEEGQDMMTTTETDMMVTEEGDMGSMNMLADIAPPDNETNVPSKEAEGCDANGKQPVSTILFLLLLITLRWSRRRLPLNDSAINHLA